MKRITKIQHGGLDYHFTGRVLEKLICSICTKPLADPHLTICCGQHFCEMCLQSSFLAQRTEKCPHCRAEGEDFQHVLDKKLRREVDSLQIFCPHKSKGCEWTGEVSSLKQHFESMSGCGFVELDCPNKCKIAKLKRNTIDNHLKNECENRPSRCQFCGYTDVFKSFKGDKGHYTVCLEFQLECPNKCGVKNLRRNDLKSHQRQCLRKLIECPFEEAGCVATLMQHELKQHMSTQQQQHLLLLMEAHKEVRSELQKTTEELQRHIIMDAEMKQALVLDLKLLRASLTTNSDQTNFALASIQTQIGEAGYNWLKRLNDRIAFRMLNFNHHKSTGKVWHSPPFYYKDGYKMRLAVHPSQLKSGKQSVVVLFLLLIKGEYDSDLKWPIQSNFELKISVLEQQATAFPTTASAEARSTTAKVEFCPRCNNLERFNCLGRNESSREVEILGSFWVEDDVQVMSDSIVLSAKVTMHQHTHSL